MDAQVSHGHDILLYLVSHKILLHWNHKTLNINWLAGLLQQKQKEQINLYISHYLLQRYDTSKS